MKGEHTHEFHCWHKVMMVATLTSEWLPASAVLLLTSYWYRDRHLSELAARDSGKTISLPLCWAASELKGTRTEQLNILELYFQRYIKCKWRHWGNCGSSLLLMPTLKLIINWTNWFGIIGSNFNFVTDLLGTQIPQYSSCLFCRIYLVVHA